MDPRQLKVLKDKTKVLEAYPDFAPGNRSKDFPKPLKQLRRYDMVSDLITVADHHVIAFAVIESQSKVGRAEYERSSYFVDKSLVFDKEQLPQMLRTLN